MMAARRILIALLVLVLSACSDLIVPESDDSQNVADFESAWLTVQSVYPYFAFKKINWDSIHVLYRPAAEAARGDEIDDVLYRMLGELKDAHVSMQSKGGSSVSPYHPPRADRDRNAYSPLVVRKYFGTELRLSGNNRIEYEVIAGNLGYVYISTLSKDEPVLDGFDQALAYLQNTKGLVIDVRHNTGGSDNNSIGIIQRLITSSLDLLPYPLPGGSLQEGSRIYPRGPFQYTQPVVLLLNGVCFSSCEDFAEMMKHVATVTAIGDTTSGGSGAPQSYALPSGRKINVSTKDIRRYDGQPIEWNGVPPDILVRQTASDISQGRDPQLEYALWFLQRIL